MKNNLLPSLLAVYLLAATDANAQPANGVPLPGQPSANEMLSKEKDFFEEAKQLASAESAYETSKLALIQSKLLQLGVKVVSKKGLFGKMKQAKPDKWLRLQKKFCRYRF